MKRLLIGALILLSSCGQHPVFANTKMITTREMKGANGERYALIMTLHFEGTSIVETEYHAWCHDNRTKYYHGSNHTLFTRSGNGDAMILSEETTIE